MLLLRTAVLVLAALVLASCALGLRFAYVRADGQDINGDPALSRQFNSDRVICESAMHQTDRTADPRYPIISTDAIQQCMEDRGYVVVMDSDAGAKQQEFAAKAAEKARREAEAAAPPPPPPPPPSPPPPHHAAKPKPKPKPPAPPAALQTSPNN